MQFNTVGVSDGISMGTSGMRYSLPSRELIADVDRVFEPNNQSRKSLEDALEQLGIDIRNVELEKVKLCDGVPENHQ